MKKCIYTCIIGDYDTLKDPLYIDYDFDYICFSDHFIKSDIWRVVPIPKNLRFLPKIKQQRIIKICPHRYLRNYDISIWLDGSIQIQKSMNDFIKNYDLNKNSFYVRIHPSRNCIYKEAKSVLAYKKETTELVEKIISRYKNENYPENIGLAETGVILRKHNDKNCVLIDNDWAIEILNYSHRDQLSFNYICWKRHFIPGYLTNQYKINNDYFKLYSHNNV